jgi:acyl carrier protein
MSKEEIFKVLAEILQSDLEKRIVITHKTNPFIDLGKDSHDGVVVACLLSERLGIEIPDDANPLVDDEQKRPRLVGEIVDYCLDVYTNSGGVHVSK